MDRPKPPATTPIPDTMVPPRNFTLSMDERLRAFVQGVPGHIRRRRRIEDLEERLLRKLAASLDPATSAELATDLATLNDLIDQHNRYYPIEARLPIEVKTRTLLDRGAPWRPLPRVTMADLAARARG